MGSGPFLKGDQPRRYQQGEEAVEDEQVRDARVGVAQQSSVAEDLGQQPREALPETVEAVRIAAEAPQPRAASEAVGDEADRDESEPVDQRAVDDVPVDLARRYHAVPLFAWAMSTGA
jgi:hypothetical protein